MLALAGAIAIAISLASHANVTSRVDVFNQRRPMTVLVAIQGTPLQPAFISFLAVVEPQSRVLTVIPVSGETPVTVGGTREPLYLAASAVPAKETASVVSRALGIPVPRYFVITSADLQLVLHALYYHATGWPAQETPLTMLNILGYPNGRTAPSAEIRLLTEMTTRLPLVNPLAASSLLVIPKNSATNLTSYQLFLLANYIRGDSLQTGHLTRHPAHHGRVHG